MSSVHSDRLHAKCHHMYSRNNLEADISTSLSLVCSVIETTTLFAARSDLVFSELQFQNYKWIIKLKKNLINLF